MSNTIALILAITFIIMFVVGIALVISFVHKWGLPLSGHVSKEDIEKIEKRLDSIESNLYGDFGKI